MKKLISLSVLVGCFSLPAQAQQPFDVAGDVAFVANDGPSGSDFDGSARVSGMVLMPLAPNLSIEGGLSQTNETEDSQTDNTGSYSLKIRTGDVFAGVRVQSDPVGQFRFYGRAGLLYYYSEIDFEESFFDIKPGGDLTEIEEGTGYYLGGGLSMPLNPGLSLTAEATYRERSAYFEDADNEFDMEELGVAVGLVFQIR